MAQRGKQPDPKRLLWVSGVALAWTALILLRLVYLQVVRHSDLAARADRQQHARVVARVTRGVITDRTGQPLAMSLPADTVCVNPLNLKNREVAAQLLAPILGLDPKETYRKIETAYLNHRGFLVLKKKFSVEESAKIRQLKLEGVEFRTEGQRFYPNDELAAAVVGSVDHVERGDAGLEKKLDAELRGRNGIVRRFTDAQRRGIQDEVTIPAQPGVNLTLTIDARIQYACERALEAAAKQYGALSGSVVVMDPYTGDILAMASWPTFDPNERPGAGAQDIAKRVNQAVQMAFEPGSVFKVVSVGSAIDAGRVTPETKVDASNGVFIGRVLHEAHRGRTYGVLSVADVLAKSSNIGAARIGTMLGEDKLHEYVLRWGFGSPTGIPLPSESAGRVRKKWQPTSLVSVAMGHEVQTSPIQLARACAVVANGGLLVKPRLIHAKQLPGEAKQIIPAEPGVRILKPETTIKMRQMMEGVIVLPYGTGHLRARIPGYSCGGKTGSAQIYDFASKHYTSYYNGSFMGFAPVTNPKVVISVTLNHVKVFGGVVAGPVFRQVGIETLRILDVPKDLPDTEGEPKDAAPVEEDADIYVAEQLPPPSPDDPQPAPMPVLLASANIPNVVRDTAVTFGPTVPSFFGKTMRAVLAESMAKGLRVELHGNGVARLQQPPAGTPLNPDETIKVQFAR